MTDEVSSKCKPTHARNADQFFKSATYVTAKVLEV